MSLKRKRSFGFAAGKLWTLRKHPVFECYMVNKGVINCSSGQTTYHRPVRLASKSGAVQKRWCSWFAQRNEVPMSVAEEIVAKAKEIRLFSIHTGEVGSCLVKVQKEARICSVCNESGTVRRPKEVTIFPWSRLSQDENNVCVVEDALAVFKGPNIRPSDIKYICSSCRKVVCAGIDMKANLPRHQTASFQRGDLKQVTDYGPTPFSIRSCNMFVKKELAKKGVFVVFLKSVREQYDLYTDRNGEQQYALKDDRSLKKYMQPSLTAAGIHLMRGPLKLGSFFCTSKKFSELAAKAKKLSQSPLTLTPDAQEILLDQFGEYIRSRQVDISRSIWQICEFVRAVPALIWWREVELNWAQSSQIKRRCRSIASLRNTHYNEKWPCNPLFCPEDMRSLPNYEFTFVISVYFGIERTVYLRSSRRTRGSIVTSLSLVSLTNTSISYLSLLNRLGCAASYQLLDIWRRSLIDDRIRQGPFQELKPGALVAMGVDNINLRASHSLNVHGSTYNGFDGLAMQAVNPNPSFDFESYCDLLAVSDPSKLSPKDIQMPSKPLSTSRIGFIQENFPCRTQDPNIVGFKWLATGLAVAHEENIATENETQQRSFRRVLLNALKGSTGGKARIEYVDVKGCNPNEEFEIIRLLESIENYFNPSNCDRMTLVVVVGDQPIFKILFKLYTVSVVKKTRLHRWMIPIPGGFHIDKQGLIAMLKIILSGSGLEEGVQFTGLPKKKQESIVSYGHYRKNRRLISQYTAAQLLRISEVVANWDPDLKEDIRSLKEEIDCERKISQREREELYKKTNRSSKIKLALPNGCELAVAESVSPRTIEIGRRIVDAVKKIAEDSVNMKFFGEVQLLDILVPWNAYNILTRKGMTKLIDKFWFSFVGLLHVTNKLNYQENMLMYAIVKSTMPEAARYVLYDKGHYVINMHETATDTNVAQDDCVESKIIRDTKRMNTNDPKTIESSPPLAMALGRAQQSIDKELHPVVRSGFLESENQQSNEPRKRDREAKTAINVLKMLQFLRSRLWLGEDHRRRPEVINVLRETWSVVSNTSFFEQYVNAEETGRLAASLHLGAKFYQIFRSLTSEELEKYFDNKPLKAVQNRWTKKFMFRTMADMEPGTKVGFKRGRNPQDKTYNKMTKRMKHLYAVKGSLNKIINTAAEKKTARVMDAARVILRDVENNDHILTSKAFAYRYDLSSELPYHGRDNFLSALQNGLAARGYLESGTFLKRDISPGSLPIVATHLDITSEVKLSPPLRMQRTTVGEAVYDKVEKFVKPLVMSSVHLHVQEFHIHVDVTHLLPLQHPSANAEEKVLPKQVLDGDEWCGEAEQHFGMCNTWTPMKETWSSLLSNPLNFNFLKYLHAASAAKATVIMRTFARTYEASGNDHSFLTGDQGGCTVFLHGTAIAITNEARKCTLSELTFSRMEGKVLLSKMTRIEASRPQVFGVEGTEVDIYGAECCWKVTEMGFERYPSGDSAHGESQTRIVHSI